jgi:hypothetical protein
MSQDSTLPDLDFTSPRRPKAMRVKYRSYAESLSNAVIGIWTSQLFAYVMVAAGVVLRIAQFRFDRALWYDEAALALNFADKTFAGLVLNPLANDQAAPPGFLVLEKLAYSLLGNNEPALRLVSLIAGIASMVLFYLLAKRLLRPQVLPLALLLFAASNGLIYYSAMVKQYSGDVAIALLLMLMTHHLLTASEEPRSPSWLRRRFLLLGIVGVVAIWFSHPAVFVLAGMGTCLFIFYFIRQNRVALLRLGTPMAMWGVSFAILYFVSLRPASGNTYLQDYWRNHYFPLIPTSLSQVDRLFDTLIILFRTLMPFAVAYSAAMLASFLGAVYFFVERRLTFAFLVLPVTFTVLASSFHFYPLGERLILFLLPIALMLIAEGMEEIVAKAGRNLAIIRVAVLGFFLVFSFRQINVQQSREEIRPVLGYIQEHIEPGDVIYVHHGAKYAFRYYMSQFGLEDEQYIIGIDSIGEEEYYLTDLEQVRGKARVWVLFSHLFNDELAYIRDNLDHMGVQVDAFVPEVGGKQDSQVYLYDLSASSP